MPESFHDEIESVKSDVVTKPMEATVGMSINHQFARSYETPQEGAYQKCISALGAFFGCFGTIPCCVCRNPYQSVETGHVGMITRFGALSRLVDPGSSYVNTWAEKMYRVPIRIQNIEIPPHECLTRDNVSVQVASALYFNVVDPKLATFGIDNLNLSLSVRTQTTLRDVIGARSLQDVIERREEIAEDISNNISHIAASWGVHIESILIKDIHLPSLVSSSLSKVAEAQRIGESKVIAAKAEVQAAKLMRNVADLLSSSPAMQIRYLDAMQTMARTSGTKVIFMPYSPNATSNSGETVPTEHVDHAKKVLVDQGFSQQEVDSVLKTSALQQAINE